MSSWTLNPGDDRSSPDSDLPLTTRVKVRFINNVGFTRTQPDDWFDDAGEIHEFYWAHDGVPSDIHEYLIVKE